MRACFLPAGATGTAYRASARRTLPEFAANEPEVLAQHFGEAGLPERACDYRMRAGDRAVSRSAYRRRRAFSAGLKLPDESGQFR